MTGTDLTPTTVTRELVVPSGPEAVSAQVERYAADLLACKTFAEAIVDTPFVPAAFWPAPVIQRGDQVITLKASGRDAWDFRRRHPQESDEAFAWRRNNAIATSAAIVYSGAALGLNWQAAVSGIYVANGRTSLYAEQMRALILAAGHEFRIVERTAERCRLSVRRVGEQEFTEFAFTMDEAIVAGYVKGKGPNTGQDAWKGNDRYNTNPADMLIARCTSIAAKGKFADVIRGMAARELLADERPDPVDITASVDVSPPEPRPDRAAILAAAERQPEAGPGSVPRETEQPMPGASRAVLPISDAQLRKLGAVFGDLGVTGQGSRADRLRIASEIVGRDLETSKDLTLDEARMLIDTLEGNGMEIAGRILGWSSAPSSGGPEILQQDDMGGADADGDADFDPTAEQDWQGGDRS